MSAQTFMKYVWSCLHSKSWIMCDHVCTTFPELSVIMRTQEFMINVWSCLHTSSWILHPTRTREHLTTEHLYTTMTTVNSYFHPMQISADCMLSSPRVFSLISPDQPVLPFSCTTLADICAGPLEAGFGTGRVYALRTGAFIPAPEPQLRGRSGGGEDSNCTGCWVSPRMTHEWSSLLDYYWQINRCMSCFVR